VSCHYRVTRWGLEILGRALFGLRTDGKHHIPERGPVLIASNHRSALDPVVVGTAAGREIHYLAKEELFRSRLTSWLLRAYNAFPVRRGTADRRAMGRVLSLLRRGEAVLLFPEGTRNRGPGFLPPRAGAGMLAGRAGVPVVPALVDGTEALFTQIRRRSLRVRFGVPIPVPEIREGDRGRKNEYRAVAATIMKRIAALAAQPSPGPSGAGTDERSWNT
jgi:1-acyl-sn-glycerol-3-phosphate acyltransferase